LGRAKIIQRVFPSYDETRRINPLLLLAVNTVRCYSARLKDVANVAAATTIAASEKRKKAIYRKVGSSIQAVLRRKIVSLLFKTY
jgi:hypothetical protein